MNLICNNSALLTETLGDSKEIPQALPALPWNSQFSTLAPIGVPNVSMHDSSSKPCHQLVNHCFGTIC